MPAGAVDPRGRRGSGRYGPSSRRSTPVPLAWRAGLAALPAALFSAHLAFGLNQTAAALWLAAFLGAALLVALATPLRSALYDLAPAAPPAALFAATLLAGLWSLTPWTPGGPHPLWAWAGVDPSRGASTLDPAATVVELVKLVGLAAAFLIGALQAARSDRGQATTEAVVWIGAAYAAVSLFAFVTGVQIASGERLSGGFLSANNAATVFAVLVVLALSLFLRGWRRSSGLGLARRLTKTAAPIAALALCATCLLLTASRMGVAAAAVGAAALLVWEAAAGKSWRAPVLAAVALLGGVGLLAILAGNTLLFARVGEIDADMRGRAEIFAAHWQAFLASPLFGYGLGTFDAVNTQHLTSENALYLWRVRAAHNVYLQWLEEGGLIGALPMFASVAVVLAFGIVRAAAGRSPLHRGLVCACAVVLVHGLTDYALQVPSIAAFWAFLLGLQFTYGRRRA